MSQPINPLTQASISLRNAQYKIGFALQYFESEETLLPRKMYSAKENICL